MNRFRRLLIRLKNQQVDGQLYLPMIHLACAWITCLVAMLFE